jgi:hypothetical protein
MTDEPDKAGKLKKRAADTRQATGLGTEAKDAWTVLLIAGL